MGDKPKGAGRFAAFDAKRDALAARGFTGEKLGKSLRAHLYPEIIYHYLAWNVLAVSREQVARALGGEQEDSPLGRAIANYSSALDYVQASARSGAGFGADLLCNVHRLLTAGIEQGGGEFRRGRAVEFVPGIAPLEADLITGALARTAEWFNAESLAELHPLEQATLALMRIVEIQPFVKHNLTTALLSASIFLLRADLPFPLLRAAEFPLFNEALARALSTLWTQDLTRLLAGAVESALDELNRAAG